MKKSSLFNCLLFYQFLNKCIANVLLLCLFFYCPYRLIEENLNKKTTRNRQKPKEQEKKLQHKSDKDASGSFDNSINFANSAFNNQLSSASRRSVAIFLYSHLYGVGYNF